ncbi:hypothetical protein [Chryseobacterium hispalense]|uniref:hypothetical protein n=1 Tax=Chryseobacterium hispalense TaxID=1453492 RepID=UPI0004936B87|nr:hypothetical protein [Chryseobacterium hispalense]
MKKVILLLNIILFYSCLSQQKKSIRQVNDYLLKNNYSSLGELDSTQLQGMKNAISKYRLLGKESCNMNQSLNFLKVLNNFISNKFCFGANVNVSISGKY